MSNIDNPREIILLEELSEAAESSIHLLDDSQLSPTQHRLKEKILETKNFLRSALTTHTLNTY